MKSCCPSPIAAARAGHRCGSRKILGRTARGSQADYQQAALKQGHVAVNSILRDWIKGQVTAIETGILSFEAVFMPYMLTADGRPVIERIKDENLLPSPQEPKVVSIAR
jgi:hypothetical protein